MTDTTDPPMALGLDSRDRLKAWMKANGLHYIVLDAERLTDALSLEELEVFQQIAARYEEHCRGAGLNPADEDWFVRANAVPGGFAAFEEQLPSLRLQWRNMKAKRDGEEA